MTRSARTWFLNRSLTSKLVVIFSLPILFVVVVSAWTLTVFEEFDSAELLVLRSNHIRRQAVYYRELIASVQNAFRGYVISQDDSFLSRYDEYKSDLDLAGFELARLVQDSPLQSQRDLVANVQALTRSLIEEKDGVIAHLRSGARDEAVSYIKRRRGQESVEVISSLLSMFQTVAARLQEERQTAVEAKRAILVRAIVAGTILTLLATALGVVVVAASVTKPMAALARAAVEIGEAGYAVFPEADRRDEIGALSRSMEEMQRRLVPAERLAAMTRMATSIAHDLRTPLLGIERGLQGLQYLADGQLTTEGRALVEDIRMGAHLAVGIVEDILDLYRQAYGELPLSYTRFSLPDLVREAADLMGAEVKDRRISIAIEGTVPPVWADRRRVFRVMINLLDNAIKNSPTGGNVSVVIAAQGEGRDRRAVVAVEDEGSGLDPAVLDTLFEPSRPVSSPSRGGTGLGLYLCRLVIGAHQGRIIAQNRHEGGARFIFDIPIERKEVSDVHPTPDRRRPASVPSEPSHRP